MNSTGHLGKIELHERLLKQESVSPES
jgi:hypothetical protein